MDSDSDTEWARTLCSFPRSQVASQESDDSDNEWLQILCRSGTPLGSSPSAAEAEVRPGAPQLALCREAHQGVGTHFCRQPSARVGVHFCSQPSGLQLACDGIAASQAEARRCSGEARPIVEARPRAASVSMSETEARPRAMPAGDGFIMWAAMATLEEGVALSLGAVLAASKVAEAVLEANAGMAIFKFGIASCPHYRFTNTLYGYNSMGEKYTHMHVLLQGSPQVCAELETQLVARWRGVLGLRNIAGGGENTPRDGPVHTYMVSRFVGDGRSTLAQPRLPCRACSCQFCRGVGTQNASQLPQQQQQQQHWRPPQPHSPPISSSPVARGRSLV